MPRQACKQHLGTRVCEQSARKVGEGVLSGSEEGELMGFVSVRPSEEAEAKNRKTKKEPTAVAELSSREEWDRKNDVDSGEGGRRESEGEFDLPSEPAEEQWEP